MKTRKTICNFVFVVMTCILAATATQSAFGTELAYDGFSGYALGAIHNKPMLGTGFGTVGTPNWRLFSATSADVVSGGLTYSNGGQDLVVSGNQQVDQVTVNDSLGAVFTNSVSTGTVYMSALAMASTSNTGGTWGPTITINGPNIANGAVNIPHDGAVHLAVIKLDLAAAGKTDDTITLWLDPTPGSTEIASAGDMVGSPSILLRTDADWSGTLTRFVARGGWDMSFDEVRLGTTWGDVTAAVPEPSTFALLALGLLGMLGWGGRRRQ